MKIKTLKQVYFSPTGTTKKVVNRIAKNLKFQTEELYDITKEQGREAFIQASENDLLIVGVPVYMARVPALINTCLKNIVAQNTPVICVVVYGNRTYGNALLELNDILKDRGCIPIAGAAFIGEHSFSSTEIPLALNRPNANDLELAYSFGKEIQAKLLSISASKGISKLQMPGNFPYGGVTELWSVDFISISGQCIKKGICADVCPAGAINPADTSQIDTEKCISCCACIKSCPENARSIKESKVKEASIRLCNLYSEPKEPDLFY